MPQRSVGSTTVLAVVLAWAMNPQGVRAQPAPTATLNVVPLSTDPDVEPPPAAPKPVLPSLPSLPSPPDRQIGAKGVSEPEVGTELGLFALESEIAKLSVSVASKREESVDEAPGSIVVISKQQIQDMNARTLREVLNVFVPGMDVVPTYFRYGDRVNEGIYSRGLLSDFSQQVLILWNGQTKWNETTFASPFVAVQFNLENIERIEISRSPSPIQGGAAITVINLVTREQFLRNSAEGHLSFSFNDRDPVGRGVQGFRATGIFGFDLGKLRASGSVQYHRDSGQAHRDPNGRAGFSDQLDLDTLRDGIKNAANFTLSLESQDGRFLFQNWLQYTSSDAFLSGQVLSPNIDLYKYEGTQWLSSLRIRPFRTLQIMAGSMLARWANVVDVAGTPVGGDESNYNVYVETNYEFKFQAAGKHSLLTGLRYEREGQYAGTAFLWNGQSFNYSSDPALLFAPNADRDIFSAYADEAWRLIDNRLHLTGGVRFDVYRGFGSQTELGPSGRVALLFNPWRALGIKLLYSTAIRPPSIYERLGTALVPLRGSQDITSERIHTIELSLTGRVKGFSLVLTPFFEWFENKIEYVRDGSSFTASNNGVTRVLGMDVDARYHFNPGTYLFVNGSYVHSYDVQNSNQTYFLPSTYVNGGVNVRWKGLNFNTNGYFRDKRPLPENLVLNTANTGFHFMWNASLAYTLWGGLTPFLSVENLTDQLNSIPLSTDGLTVPMRGRTFHLGLRYTPSKS